jgi:PEP-CTERM motif
MGNSRSLLSIASIAAAAAFAVMPITASPLAAATISVTIQFDLVKVTTSMAGGFLVYTASPVGKGPYETRDGADPIEFFKQKPDGDDATFLNGFTGASIVNNALQPRYFGSVASSKGSILRNATNIKVVPSTEAPGYKTVTVPGSTITGFVIELAKPTEYDIDSADGGNAFKMTDVATNKKSVTFSGGSIPVANYPAVGKSADFLWSFITKGPQPKFPAVMFTKPTIPPTGDFTDVLYVGRATVPEPSTFVLMALAFAGIALLRRPWEKIGGGRIAPKARPGT